MDSLGDYIYIIAFIAIVVINLLKKTRKQAAVPIPPPEFEEEAKDAGRVYREPFPPSSTLKSFPSKQTVADAPQKKTPSSTVAESQKKPLGDVAVKDAPIDDAFPVAFKDTDDARRAFIYSEIWARKY